MKKINIIFRITILAFLPVLTFGQTFSDREITEKTFPVNAQTTIEVNNKYGKIHVIPWRKDSVKFEIDLVLSSNSLSKLHKIKNGIRFDFTSSKYYVTALTDFGGTGNQIFTELRNLSESLIPGKNNIEVNYRIYCPESTNLTLINKFGDIYIDDLRGKINISLSNGDIKVNSISGEAQIELNFGSGIFNHLTDANIASSYGDINIKQAEKVQTVTKSSTLHIDDVDFLKIDSKRDKFFIGDVHTLRGSTNFSQIWIEKIKCELDVNLKFGDLTVDRIPVDFCKINLVSDYADLNLYLQPETKYQADIFHHKDAYINFPSNEAEIGLTTLSRSEEEMHSFYRTSEDENIPVLKIHALEKCYINLINK
jgi:hypothetical protein